MEQLHKDELAELHKKIDNLFLEALLLGVKVQISLDAKIPKSTIRGNKKHKKINNLRKKKT